jgi:hypothetical protein
MSGHSQFLDRVGTVHDLRWVIFDNDTRVIFASTLACDLTTTGSQPQDERPVL